jgi:hypothetical protein
LQGRPAIPTRFATEQSRNLPASISTPPHGKILTMKSAAIKIVDGPKEKPALTLAKGFDSYEATMRLAAITGTEKALAGSSPADRSSNSEDAVAVTATRQGPAGVNTRQGTNTGDQDGNRSSYAWVWIASIVAVLIAAALFLLR